MYELPTHGNVMQVVVDEATIEGQGKPLLVYSDDTQTSAAGAAPQSTPRAVRDAAA